MLNNLLSVVSNSCMYMHMYITQFVVCIPILSLFDSLLAFTRSFWVVRKSRIKILLSLFSFQLLTHTISTSFFFSIFLFSINEHLFVFVYTLCCYWWLCLVLFFYCVRYFRCIGALLLEVVEKFNKNSKKTQNASHLIPLQLYNLVPATNTTDIWSITLTRKYRYTESRILWCSHTFTIMHLSHMQTHDWAQSHTYRHAHTLSCSLVSGLLVFLSFSFSHLIRLIYTPVPKIKAETCTMPYFFTQKRQRSFTMSLLFLFLSLARSLCHSHKHTLAYIILYEFI